MEINQLFKELNNQLRRRNEPELKEEEFLTSLAGLSAKGIIQIIGTQCYLRGKLNERGYSQAI